MVHWSWFSQEAKRTFDEYVVSLPERETGAEFGLPSMMRKPTADDVIVDLVCELEVRKTLKRKCRTQTLIRLKGDKPDEYRAIKVSLHSGGRRADPPQVRRPARGDHQREEGAGLIGRRNRRHEHQRLPEVLLFLLLRPSYSPCRRSCPSSSPYNPLLLPKGSTMTDEDRIIHPSPFPDWYRHPGYFLPWRLALRQDQRPEGQGRAACRVGAALDVERDRGRQAGSTSGNVRVISHFGGTRNRNADRRRKWSPKHPKTRPSADHKTERRNRREPVSSPGSPGSSARRGCPTTTGGTSPGRCAGSATCAPPPSPSGSPAS